MYPCELFCPMNMRKNGMHHFWVKTFKGQRANTHFPSFLLQWLLSFQMTEPQSAWVPHAETSDHGWLTCNMKKKERLPVFLPLRFGEFLFPQINPSLPGLIYHGKELFPSWIPQLIKLIFSCLHGNKRLSLGSLIPCHSSLRAGVFSEPLWTLNPKVHSTLQTKLAPDSPRGLSATAPHTWLDSWCGPLVLDSRKFPGAPA